MDLVGSRRCLPAKVRENITLRPQEGVHIAPNAQFVAVCQDVARKQRQQLPSCLDVLNKLIHQGHMLHWNGQVLIAFQGGRTKIIGVSISNGSVMDFKYKFELGRVKSTKKQEKIRHKYPCSIANLTVCPTEPA